MIPRTLNALPTFRCPDPALAMLGKWKSKAKRTAPEDLVFGTRAGKPAPSNNILNRQIAPACDVAYFQENLFIVVPRQRRAG